MPRGEDIVCISAKTGAGIPELLQKIDKHLDKGARRVTLHIPYSEGSVMDMLYREAKVESVEYSETTDVVAVCTPKILGRVEQWIESKPID